MTDAELRATFLFQGLSDDQLAWLRANSDVVEVEAGEQFITQGEPPDALYVLLDGALQLTKTLADRELVFSAGSTPGTWAGWLPIFDDLSQLTARTLRPSRLLRIRPEAVKQMMKRGYPITAHLMTGAAQGFRKFEAIARHQEKLAALGKLAAGLAHELNNPAAAVRRAGDALLDAGYDRDLNAFTLGRLLDPPTAKLLVHLVRDAAARPVPAIELGPLERADREDALAAWLDDRGVAGGFELAGTLVEVGISEDDLQRLAEAVPAEAFPAAVAWVAAAITTQVLTGEIERGAARISELVRNVKDYTFMDRALEPEPLDIRKGLDDTLAILAYPLRGITVERDYAADLPSIWAIGSELNQVWTNLIDNAIDAVAEAPHGPPWIVIRARPDATGVLVEIEDNGPGIPPDVQRQMFEPFFTTKSMGKGTGMGLDTSYRIVVAMHFGTLKVESAPGKTCFRVWLPQSLPVAAADRQAVTIDV